MNVNKIVFCVLAVALLYLTSCAAADRGRGKVYEARAYETIKRTDQDAADREAKRADSIAVQNETRPIRIAEAIKRQKAQTAAFVTATKYGGYAIAILVLGVFAGVGLYVFGWGALKPPVDAVLTLCTPQVLHAPDGTVVGVSAPVVAYVGALLSGGKPPKADLQIEGAQRTQLQVGVAGQLARAASSAANAQVVSAVAEELTKLLRRPEPAQLVDSSAKQLQAEG